jgi:hypothetical protein
MANKPKKRRRSSAKKGKIVLKQKVEIVQKKDNVRTQQPDTLRRMNAQMPRTSGAVFKVKLKKK